MLAQQFNVDVISNNIANVNTHGYKKNRVEFKDLLYQTINRAYMFENGGRPVNLQVGHGVRPAATTKDFSQGAYETTDDKLDFAIEGDAFFVVRSPRGEVYTREGNLKLSITADGLKLTTNEGYPILDENGQDIIIDFDVSQLNVSLEGDLSYNEMGETIDLGQRIALVRFDNKAGLESIGDNFFAVTSASGEPMPNSESDPAVMSFLRQGMLEMSNVRIAEEMVKLIVAQRAYEVNSKCIQASDDMMGIANNLRR